VYRGDNLIVGKVFGPAALGVYLLAYRISEVVTVEIAKVVDDVAFPAYARLQDRPERLREAFRILSEIVVSLALPVAIALMLLAKPVTGVLLGDRWTAVADILPILALAGVGRSWLAGAAAVLRGIGRPGLALQQGIVSAVAMYSVMFPLALEYGLRGVAMACLVGSAAATPVAAWQTGRALEMGAKDLVRSILPGLTLAICVGTAIVAGGGTHEWLGRGMVVGVSFALASFAFALASLLLWSLGGCGPLRLLPFLQEMRRQRAHRIVTAPTSAVLG
jgi:O-antigen/teichoic acid export membrane protein